MGQGMLMKQTNSSPCFSFGDVTGCEHPFTGKLPRILSGMGALKKATPTVSSPRDPVSEEGDHTPRQQASAGHSPMNEATADPNAKKCEGCGRTFNAKAFVVHSRICAKVEALSHFLWGACVSDMM